jgi:hypothetical protein
MPTQNRLPLRHSNKYSAASACVHCGGVIRHESWCKTQSASVRYAFQVTSHPSLLTLQDSLILHALGVAWNGKKREVTAARAPSGRAENIFLSASPRSSAMSVQI